MPRSRRFDLVFLDRGWRNGGRTARNHGFFTRPTVGARCSLRSAKKILAAVRYHGGYDIYRANLWNSLNSSLVRSRPFSHAPPRTMTKWCSVCFYTGVWINVIEVSLLASAPPSRNLQTVAIVFCICEKRTAVLYRIFINIGTSSHWVAN